MRRRRKGHSKHLSLSATDADWAMVRAKAARRELSMARYVRWLVECDAGVEEAEPPLAFDAEEWREVRETVRSLPARLHGETDASPLIESLHRQVGALVDAWALEMLRAGRREALRALLTARMGAQETERFIARIEALASPVTAPPARRPGRESNGPSGQGSLFG